MNIEQLKFGHAAVPHNLLRGKAIFGHTFMDHIHIWGINLLTSSPQHTFIQLLLTVLKT